MYTYKYINTQHSSQRFSSSVRFPHLSIFDQTRFELSQSMTYIYTHNPSVGASVPRCVWQCTCGRGVFCDLGKERQVRKGIQTQLWKWIKRDQKANTKFEKSEGNYEISHTWPVAEPSFSSLAFCGLPTWAMASFLQAGWPEWLVRTRLNNIEQYYVYNIEQFSQISEVSAIF